MRKIFITCDRCNVVIFDSTKQPHGIEPPDPNGHRAAGSDLHLMNELRHHYFCDKCVNDIKQYSTKKLRKALDDIRKYIGQNT